MVITATADLDEAIADLVHSAFGHAGQKCSAASLAIVEAPVHDDRRFLRRLADAVRSLVVGPAWDLATSMGPLIRPPQDPLLDAFTRLGPGERWLVPPAPLDEHRYLWSPGVKVGVAPGSSYHLTECFGPVLGVMRAADLDEAIRWQNQPAYGLTAGLHALDPRGDRASGGSRVHAGNLYVNRGTTGAIVRRQPFGGWKRSVVGPGAKAGGPNYVASLGTWPVRAGGRAGRRTTPAACRRAWADMQMPGGSDRPPGRGQRLPLPPPRRGWPCAGGSASTTVELACARAAAAAVGVAMEVVGRGRRWSPGPRTSTRSGCSGEVADSTRLAALDTGCWVDDIPVAADARPGDPALGPRAGGQRNPAPAREHQRPAAGPTQTPRPP